MPHQYFNTRRAEPILSELELYSEYRNCDRWAIIVGISRYQNQSWNLRYADRDAEELYNLLLTPSGGNFKKEFIRKLTNEEATTGNITRALRAFLKKPAREDLVVIYFACHGTPDFDRPSNVYLLTHDTAPDDIAGTALPMREIDLSLKENLHAEKVIVLADTCHSAAIGGGIGRRNAVDDSTFVNRYLQEVSRARGGIALLTSAEATEVSFEDARWGGGHGVFTHYLLEGMRGAADHDGNGIVTVGELFEYVRDNVKRATDYRQHPLIGANAYDRNLPMAIMPGGDFVVKENLNQLEKLKDKPLSARESIKNTSNDTDINSPLTETISPGEAEYKNKIRRYEQEFTKAVQAEYPLNQLVINSLKVLQQQLGLKDEDVAQIEKSIQEPLDVKYQERLKQQQLVERQQQTELEKRYKLEQEKQRQEAEQQHQEREKIKYENKLRGYEQKFTKAVQGEYPFDQPVVDELKALQKKLQLKNEDITRVEQPIREIAEAKYQEKLKQQEQAEQRRKRWKQENRSLYEEMILTDEELDELIKEEEQSYIFKIVNLLVAEVRKKDEIDLSTDQNAMQRLAKAATEAKTELSKYQIAKISLPFLYTAIQAPQNVLQPQNIDGILIQTKTKELNFIDNYQLLIWKYKLKDVDSGPANMYCIVGCALRDQGNLKEAISAYRKAIRLDPSLTIAHTLLEDVLKAQEQKAQEQKAQEQKAQEQKAQEQKKKFLGFF